MDDEPHQNFNFELIKGRFTPSSSPHYHINFNFNFEIKISEFVVNQGSAALTEQMDESIDDSVRVTLNVHPNMTALKLSQLFTLDTREAIKTVLTCLPLSISGNKRQRLIYFATREASLALQDSMQYGYKAVDLYILVRVQERRVFDPSQETSEYYRMIPATDSSVQSLLKKYNDDDRIDSGEINTESCCCICFQYLSSGEHGSSEELLWMPCKHVFHGDCIKKWLSTSHYCPICRFEMPTAPRCVFGFPPPS